MSPQLWLSCPYLYLLINHTNVLKCFLPSNADKGGVELKPQLSNAVAKKN